jgi:hypothetical protein
MMMASSSSSNDNINIMSSSSTTTNNNPDTVLFGSLTSTISDELDSKIDSALMKGVGSLPLLPQSSSDGAGEELFLTKLRACYRRNVDLLETYVERNIFTVQNYSVSLREKILQCFIMTSNNNSSSAVEAAQVMVKQEEQQQQETATTTIPPLPSDYPKKRSDIASSQDMDQLREETTQLRAKLRAARARKNDLQRKLIKLLDVDQSVKGANETLSNNDTDPTSTHSSVTAMIVGKQGLEYTKQEAKVLSRQLDEQEYSDEDENNDNASSSTKRPKLTLEQQYNQDTANTKLSPSGLAAMRDRLQQKKSE